MSVRSTAVHPPRHRSRFAAFMRPLVRMAGAIARRIARRRQRLALGRLTDDQLRDIGISRAEARRETGKGFWR